MNNNLIQILDELKEQGYNICRVTYLDSETEDFSLEDSQVELHQSEEMGDVFRKHLQEGVYLKPKTIEMVMFSGDTITSSENPLENYFMEINLKETTLSLTDYQRFPQKYKEIIETFDKYYWKVLDRGSSLIRDRKRFEKLKRQEEIE